MAKPTPTSPDNLMSLWSQLHGNPQVQDMLGQYGMSIPDNIKQNFMLPEAGTDNFFGRHPHLAGGIENAFMAVANMGPTSMSAGDNISNVARAIMAIPGERREHAISQIMAPFQTAQMLGELGKTGAEAQRFREQGEYYKARAGYYDRGGKQGTPHFLQSLSDPNNPNSPRQWNTLSNGSQVATPVKDGNGNNLIAPPSGSASSDPARNYVNRLRYTAYSDPNAKPLDRSNALHALHQIDDEQARASGMSAGARWGAIPGQLSDIQKSNIAAADTYNRNVITSKSQELGKLTTNAKTRAQYIAAHPETDNMTDAQSDAWANQKQQGLQHDIDFYNSARQSYAGEVQRNPSLTYSQHLKMLQGDPSIPMSMPPGDNSSPLVSPQGGGFNWDDHPDVNEDND